MFGRVFLSQRSSNIKHKPIHRSLLDVPRATAVLSNSLLVHVKAAISNLWHQHSSGHSLRYQTPRWRPATPSLPNACCLATKTAQEQLEELVRGGLKAFKGPRLQSRQSASGCGRPWMPRFNAAGINRGLSRAKPLCGLRRSPHIHPTSWKCCYIDSKPL